MNIAKVVDQALTFCQSSLGHHARGSDGYFATLALEQAALALGEGNYGIGAVAVEANATELRIFYGRNSLIKGDQKLRDKLGPMFDGVARLIGHAETIALIRRAAGLDPDLVIKKSDCAAISNSAKGVTVFGTIEPCPMCMSVMTNEQAVSRSVSTIADAISAYAFDARVKHQPSIWTEIQDSRGLTFELLKNPDPELIRLSGLVFFCTREEIDQKLGCSSS